MAGDRSMRFKVLPRGLIAGAIGTAAMTAHQQLRGVLAQSSDQGEEPGGASDPWESARAPARAARHLIEGALHKQVQPRWIPALTQIMHWSYGTMWGGAYAIGQVHAGARPLKSGALLGLGVWAASYVQLVPMGIYEPPWRDPATGSSRVTARGLPLLKGHGSSLIDGTQSRSNYHQRITGHLAGLG